MPERKEPLLSLRKKVQKYNSLHCSQEGREKKDNFITHPLRPSTSCHKEREGFSAKEAHQASVFAVNKKNHKGYSTLRDVQSREASLVSVPSCITEESEVPEVVVRQSSFAMSSMHSPLLFNEDVPVISDVYNDFRSFNITEKGGLKGERERKRERERQRDRDREESYCMHIKEL